MRPANGWTWWWCVMGRNMLPVCEGRACVSMQYKDLHIHGQAYENTREVDRRRVQRKADRRLEDLRHVRLGRVRERIHKHRRRVRHRPRREPRRPPPHPPGEVHAVRSEAVGRTRGREGAGQDGFLVVGLDEALELVEVDAEVAGEALLELLGGELGWPGGRRWWCWCAWRRRGWSGLGLSLERDGDDLHGLRDEVG